MSPRNVHLLESLEPRIMLSASLAGAAAVETGSEKGLSVETMPALATQTQTGQSAETESLFDGMKPIAETPQTPAETATQQQTTAEKAVVSTVAKTTSTPVTDVATPAKPDGAGKTVDQLSASLLTGQGPPAKEDTSSQKSVVSAKSSGISLFASGETATWLGGSGNWSDNSKWSGSVAPGADDDVVINGTGSFTVTLDVDTSAASINVMAGTLSIGAARSLVVDGNVQVATGAIVALAGNLTSGSTSLFGTMNVTGADRILDLGTLSGWGTLFINGPAITLPGMVDMGTGMIDVNGQTARLFLQDDATVGTLIIGRATNLGGLNPEVNIGTELTVNYELKIGLGTLSGEKLTLPSGSYFNNTINGTKTVTVEVVNVDSLFTWTLGALIVGNGSVWTLGPNSTSRFEQSGNFRPVTPLSESGAPFQLLNQGNMSVGILGVSANFNFQGVDFTNAGTLRVLSNQLTFQRNFTQTAGVTEVNGAIGYEGNDPAARRTFTITGGEVRGTGRISANVINGGVIRPGRINGTPGELAIIGSFSQTPVGKIAIEALGLTTGLYSTLRVNDATTPPVLAGTFELVHLPGFAATAGSSAQLLNFLVPSVSGAFGTLIGLTLPGYTFTFDPVTTGVLLGYQLAVPLAPSHDLRKWDGGGDGVSYSDPLNWEGDVLPNRLETAVIAPTSSLTVSLTAHTMAGGLILDGADAALVFDMGNFNFTDDNPSSAEGVVVRSGATLRAGTGSFTAPLLNESGGTVISNGRSFAGKVTNLGRFELGTGTTTTWNEHMQTGELVLNGATLFVYGNFTNEGLMRVTQSSALTATTSFGFRLPFINKGTLELRASLSFNTAAITNEGTWDQDGVSISFNALNGNGTFYNPGVFNLRNNSNFYIFGGAYTTIFASGGDLWVDATSSISVSGSINQLNAGRRTQIDGTASAQNVSVSIDGYLGGRGEIFGNIINGGGTVAPGAKPITGGTRTAGVLTVSGNYTTQEPTSRLEVQVFGTGTVTIDKLIAANVTLDGQLAVIGRAGAVDPGTALTFISLSGAGTLSGNFTSTEQSGFDLGTTLTSTIAAGTAALSVTTANPSTTYLWLGGDGNWNDPTKWSTGTTPGAGARVSIGSGTVTLTAGTTVNLSHFELAGGVLTGGGALTVANGFIWWGGALAGNISVTTEAAATISLATQAQENFGGLFLRDSARLELGGAQTWGYGLTINVDAGSPTLSLGTGAVVNVIGEVLFNVTNGAAFTLENKGSLTIQSQLEWSGVTLVNRGTIELNSSLIVKRFEQQTGSADLDGSALTVTNGLIVSGGTVQSPNEVTGDVTVSGGFYRVRSYQGEISGTFRLEAGGTLVSVIANSEGYRAGSVRADTIILAGALRLELAGSTDWSPVMRDRFTVIDAVLVTGEFSSAGPIVPDAGLSFVVSAYAYTGNMGREVVINAVGRYAGWVGGDGNWNDPTKWSTGAVPTYADDVNISSGTVTIDSYDVEIGSLTMTGGRLVASNYSSYITINDFADLANASFEGINFSLNENAIGLVTGTLEFGENSALNFGGSVQIQDAVLNFNGSSSTYFTTNSGQTATLSNVTVNGNYTVYFSSRLVVEGYVEFSGDFYADGGVRITPGADLFVQGNATFQNYYSQPLTIEIAEAGTTLQAGRLTVAGDATLNVDLVVSVPFDFSFAGSASFGLVDAVSRLQDFTALLTDGFGTAYSGSFETVDGLTVMTLTDVIENFVWLGGDGLGGDGYWNYADNWSAGRVPTANDVVVIAAGSGIIDLEGDTSIRIRQLQMAGGTLSDGTIEITESGEITAGTFAGASLVIADGADVIITAETLAFTGATEPTVTVNFGGRLVLGATDQAVVLDGAVLLAIAGTLEVVSSVALAQGRIVLGIGGQAPLEEINGLIRIQSTGSLNVGGDFEISAEMLSRIEIELEQIDATAFAWGTLSVAGTATLNGELVIVVLTDLTFTTLQNFVFINASARNGTFAGITVTGLSTGYTAMPVVNGNAIGLDIVAAADFSQLVADFNAGLTLVTGRLGAWLQSFNFTAGTFSLLPDTLHDLFGLGALLDQIDLSTLATVPSTLDDLRLALETLGYTVDTLTEGSLQVRIDFDFSDLGVAAGFSGNLLNLVALDGLGVITNQPSALPWLADLALTLVLGVDLSGFYLGGESALSLDVALDETNFSLIGDLGGIEDVALAGTLALAGNVSILTGNSERRYREAQITGDPASVFDPVATLAGDLTLAFALPYVTLDYAMTWSVTTDGDRLMNISAVATLSGELSLPGFKAADNTTDALFLLTATRTTEGWHLVATATGDFKLSGFTIANLVLTLDLTPDSYAGSGEGQIVVDGNADLPPLTLDFTLSFDPAGYEITGTFVALSITVGSGNPLLWLGNAIYTFNAIATGTTLDSATLSFAADDAVFFPEPDTLSAPLPSGPLHAEAVTGELSAAGRLQLIAAVVNVDLGEGLQIDVDGDPATSTPALSLDLNPADTAGDAVIATLTGLRISTPALLLGSLAVMQLQIRRNGFQLEASGELDPAARLRLGDPVLLEVAGLSMGLDLTFTVGSADPVSGEFTLTATQAALFPDLSTSAVDGVATLGDLSGMIDLATGAIEINAGTFSLLAGDHLQLTATGTAENEAIHFTWDPADSDPAATILVVNNLQLALPGLLDSSVTLPTIEQLLIRRNGFELTATFSLPGETLTLGDPALITITSPAFALDLAATRTGADAIELEASLTITATSAIFAGPDSVAFTLGDDDTGDALPGVTSVFDLTNGAFSLTARHAVYTLGEIVTGEISGSFVDQDGGSIFVPAVAFSYDPTGPPSAPLFTFAVIEGDLTVLAFNGLAPHATLTGLSVNHGGEWSLAGISITLPVGYAGVQRLGIIPFKLDGIALAFSTPGDFSRFELNVTGRFELDGLSLGFTPVIYIGDPSLIGTGDLSLITVRLGDITPFTFTLDPFSLLSGSFTPLNFGPITLGIEGLDIAGVLFDGQLSFGSFVDGIFVPMLSGFDVSGFLTIISGEGVPLGLSIDLSGNLSFPSLDITLLELATRFEFDGGALDLDLSFTYTGGLPSAPFFTLSFEASLARLTLGDIVFEIPNLFRITIGEISLTLNPGANDPVATSTDATFEFLSFPGFGPISISFIELYQSAGEIDGFILRNLFLVFSAELETTEGVTLLRLIDPRLVIDELSYLGGELAGAIGFDAVAAILLPDVDPAVFAARGEGIDPLARGVTGSLNLDTGALSFTADRFSATFGSALEISGESFTFNYDPTVTDLTVPVVTVGSATASATDFPALGSGLLTGLVITRGSASFESLTLGPGSANLDDVLLFDQLGVAFTDVNYTYATGELTGTATLTAARATLFAGDATFAAEARELTGTFELADGLDSLVLTASELEIAVHGRLNLLAEEVSFAFSGNTVATLASVEAILPDFPSLGRATISELIITRDGFTASSAVFGPAQLTRGPLQFSGLTATLAEIAYDRVDGFTAGELVFAADGIVLFPGSTAVSATLETVTATIRFTEPAGQPFTFTAEAFLLVAGRALQLEGEQLSFTLGEGDHFTLLVTDARASSPLLPGVTAELSELTVTQDGFTLASLVLDAASARVAGLLEVTDLRFTLSNLVFLTGEPLSGTVAFTAASALLLPALGAIAPRLTDDDASDALPGISGLLDLETDALTIEARRVEITLGDLIVFEIESTGSTPALSFVDDPNAAPDSALLSIASAVATIPALAVNGLAPTVTVTDFGLRRDGRYFQSEAIIDLPAGYPDVLGLGGILPLQITQLAIDFPDPDDLNSFTFSVTGIFDLESLNLPFDPILYIGDPALIGTGNPDLITILPGSATSFSFDLDVLSLRDGKIAPLDFGPITLGVENLDLGSTVVSGLIEIGRFEDGVLGPLPGSTANVTGLFTIVSSSDASLEVNATIELTGNIETIAAGVTQLSLTGVVSGSGEVGSVSGGVEITFELTLTFTANDNAPFLTAQVEGRFLSVAFTDVTIDLGFVIIHAGRVEAVFNPAPGQAQYLLSEITIEFPAYETLTGTSVDLIEMFSDRFVIEGLTIELTGTLFPDNNFVELIDFEATIDAEVGYTRSGNNFSDFELLSGGVSFTVGELNLFPGSTTFVANATNLFGSLDVNTGELTLTAESLTANVVDVISLSLLGVELYLGNAPNQPVLQVASATATIAALDDLAFTLTDLSLSRGGEFTLASAALSAPGGVLASFGLGGLLPFEITDVLLEFQDQRLDLIEVTVVGAFDFSVFESLPFTPIIRIGEVEATEASSSSFEFTLAIENLALGEISPVDFGPIEIGFADLVVGGVTLGGTIIFGGYADGIFVPSIGGSLSLGTEFENLQGGVGITLLGTYDASARRISINASFSVSFTLNDTIDVTDAALNFNFAFSLGNGGSFTLDTLTFTGASITRVEVRFGDLFIFTAVNVAIDFNPAPDGFFATFGSMTVTFPGIGGLSGSAGNFGIRADFSFASLPGFFVSLTPPSGGLLGFPDWLPVTFETITLQFADIEADPLDVAITLTVSIDEDTFPLPISGRVEGLTIDIGLLRDGKFPITNLDAFVIEFGPIAFGGLQLSGMLALGIAALDADGNLLEGLDAQNDDLVDQRILFGLIEGSVAVPGIGGLTIRLGLSEFGPLVIFVSAEIPILLEPTSGLTLFGLRGGVRFGAQFPSVTDPVTGLPDPELLRGPAFSPSGDMTAEQWLDALRQQISTIAQTGATPGQVTFADALNSPMLIELGASLGSTYLPGLSAEVDIIISTEGALLMSGALEYYLPGVMDAQFVLGEAKFFIDLRQIESGSVDIVFLLDVPGDPAILSLSGFLSFDIVFNAQNEAIGFTLVIGGKAEIAAIDVRLTGLLKLTVTTERTEIFVDASLEYPVLGPLNAQGLLVFDYSGSDLEVWGALSVSLAQSADLGPLGIEFDAGLTVQFNVSDSDKEIQFNFENTGEVIDVLIPANSFALFVNGYLYVKNGGETIFSLEGVFIIEIAADEGLTIFVEASLIIGAAGPNAPPPLLQFSALGFLKLSSAGLAGKIDVSLDTNFPEAMGLELNGSFLLIVNTTGDVVSYTPPPIPGSSQTPSSVTIPDRLSPNSAPGPYALIEAQGYLRVLGLTLEGTFSFALSADVLRVTASASLDIRIGDARLLTLQVAGGFQIDRAGLVASLSLSLSAGSNSGDYAFGGSLSFLLEINTTGRAVTQIGNLPVNLAAGRYARVMVTGSLTILGLEMTGKFGIEAGTTGFAIAAVATLNLRVQGVTLFSFSVLGALQFGPTGFAAKFALSLGAQNSAATGGSFSASFTLEINTTGQAVRTIAGVTVNLAAGRYARVTAAGSLTVGGFDLAGSFLFEVTPTHIAVNATITFALTVGGSQVASFNGQAFLEIGTRGIVGLVSLSLQTGVNSASFGFRLAGIFQLEINTTNVARTFAGGRPQLDVLTGAVVPNRTEAITINPGTVRLYLAGSLVTVVNGADVLTIRGYFEFSSSGPSAISIRAFAYVQVGTLATLWGISVFELRSTGIAAVLNLTVLNGSQTSAGNGFSLNATFQLELNTRSTTAVLTNARVKINPTTGLPVLGEFENVTIAARSFTIVATGSLRLAIGGSSFDLQGRFELRLSSQDLMMTVAAAMNVRAAGVQVFAFEASGALLINGSGIAGALRLGLQAGGGPNSSLGFDLGASFTFELEVNTTSAAIRSIGSQVVDLPAGPYVRLALSGSLVIQGFTLAGSFSFAAGVNELTVTASFTLDLRVGGTRVFMFNGNGALSITSRGVAAAITVSLGGGPNASLGFSISGAARLSMEINTTGVAVTRIGNQTVNLAAGRYARVTFGATMTVLGAELDGTFVVQVATDGIQIGATATFTLSSGGTRVMRLNVSGALLVNGSGIAAKLTATLNLGPTSGLGFSFGGNLSFGLEFNTTGQAITRIAGVLVNLAGGSDYLLVRMSGNLVLTSSFTLSGAFVFSVSSSSLSLQVAASIDVGPFANLDIDGSLSINSAGIAGFLELQAGARFTRNSAGISFDARLRLEVNTTDSTVFVNRLLVDQNNGTITSSNFNLTSIVANTIRVVVAGSLTINGTSNLFRLHGYVMLSFGSSSLQATFDAGLSLFGTRVNVDGSGGLFYGSTPGLSLRIRLTIGSSGNDPNLSASSLFSFTGTFMLEINTRSVASSGVSANTYRVSVNNARLTVLGMTLSGSFNIGVSGGVFSVTVPSSDPLTLGLWNFVTVSFSGSFRSSGYLSLTGSINVQLGSNDWNVHGRLSVSFTYNSGSISFSARLAGGATVAGFDIDLASLSINSNGVARFGTFLGDVVVNFRTGGIGFDGPVAGALVVFDANRNGLRDDGEPVTFTNDLGEYFFENDLLAYDANGNGIIDEEEGDLLLIGGRDVLTGLLVTGMLRGSAAQLGTGFGITISPLTTLVINLREFGYNQGAAEDLILNRLFGTTLTDQYLSFSIGNPYDGTLAGTPRSAEVFQNNTLLAGTIAPIAALLDAAGVNVDRDAATAAAYRAVALALLAQPGALNLGSAAVIADVINRAAQIAGVSLNAALVNATAAALAAVNTSLLALDPAGNANFAQDVLRHQIVAQDALTVLATAGNESALNDAATAAGLARLLAGATPPETEYPTDVDGGVLNPDGRTQFSIESESPVIAGADGSYRVIIFNGDITSNPRNQLVVQRVVIDATIYDAPVTLELRSSADGYKRVIATIELSAEAVTSVITLAIPLAVPVGGLGFSLTPVGAVDATTFSIDRIAVEGFVLEFFSGVYADYLSSNVPTFAQFFASLPVIRQTLGEGSARSGDAALARETAATFALEAARLLNAPAQSTAERLQATYTALIHGL